MTRVSSFIPVLLYASSLHAAGCAATPEAAVHNAVGQSGPAVTQDSTSGYRVQDVQVDAVMHRVWVRVARCNDPSQPLVLIALNASLAHTTQLSTPAQQDNHPVSAAAAPVQVAAVHPGDMVKVFFASQTMQMEVEGTADTQAAVGDAMNVTLKRRGDEPPHRIHGVLRADHRVEVQP